MPAASILTVNLSASDPADALIAGITSPLVVAPPVFPRGSRPTFTLLFVQDNPDQSDTGAPFVYAPAPAALRMGLGPIDAPPTGGTFTLTDGATAQTTAPIASDATAAVVQAAIRAALTTNYAAAVVSAGDSASGWTINRGANGAIADLSVNENLLQPAGCTSLLENDQDGTVDLHEVFSVTLLRPLAALAEPDDFTALPGAAVAVTVTTAGSGAANKQFRIRWNADAYGGAVTLSFTGDTATATVGPIAWNATADDVVAAFEPAGVAVTRNAAGDYSLTCTGPGIALSNTPALGTSSNTLQVPAGVSVVLNLDTPAMSHLLGTARTVETVFELKELIDDVPTILVQSTTALAVKDLLRSTSTGSTGGGGTGTGTSLTTATGLQFFPLVTGYTGGGATKLDGQVTTGLEVPQVIIFRHATDGGCIYVLTAGTDAESSPGTIRPDDYNASTNAKVWKSLL